MKQLNNNCFPFEGTLTAKHLEFFNKNGYLHFKNFICKATVTEFISEIEQVQQYFLTNNITRVNGIPLKFGKDMDGRPLVQRMAFASQYSKKLKAFIKGENFQLFLQLLGKHEGRIGENEKDGLVVNHYINDPASKFTQLGWHTDSPRDLFLGSKILPMLNVGVHLDDCPFKKGGLRVLPGTHRQTLFGLFFRKKYYIDNSADKKEVGFDIEAGDLTIHDGRLWHRVQQSADIGEKSRRRVMYIPLVTGAYQPKDSKSAMPFYHKVVQIKWGDLMQKLSPVGIVRNLF